MAAAASGRTVCAAFYVQLIMSMSKVSEVALEMGHCDLATYSTSSATSSSSSTLSGSSPSKTASLLQMLMPQLLQ